MFLSRLYITNYRSIKEIDLCFREGKNIIVGKNNAGKSNVVRAINLILGERSPTYDKYENITDNDFYSWKETVDGKEIVRATDDIYIWCELSRPNGEDLNYEELAKAYSYAIYGENESQGFRPNRVSRHDILDEDQVFGPDEESNRTKLWINPRRDGIPVIQRQLELMHNFAFAFKAWRRDGIVYKDMRFLYREGENSDWVLCFRVPFRNELLQSAIVPSFRDPINQLRLNNWSWYGQLIRFLTQDYEKDEALLKAISEVASVSERIFGKVTQSINKSTFDVAFPGTQIHIQFNTERRDDLYKSASIYVDDGFKSPLTEKGSGIQSATLIGLFTYYTNHVNTVTSALLCIEEPEIYLHPHARRVVSDMLDEFLGGNRNQVILTTHSPEFIRVTGGDLNVVQIQKTSTGSTARAINISSLASVLIDSNQNELFFADKIILCENLDAYILRIVAQCFFPGALDSSNVSIIRSGGKGGITTLARKLASLDIPVFVLADFDFFLRDHSIENLGADFFSKSHIFGRDLGLAMFEEVAQTRARIKGEQEFAFYNAKKAGEVTFDLLPLLGKLRNNGLCILNGEIEDLCINATFLQSKEKLVLAKVFELGERVAAGEDLHSILDTGQLEEFLQTVLRDRHS